MTAKEYLMQIIKLDTMIENKLAEISRWKALATSSTVPLGGERVQSSGSKQQMENAIVRYLHLDEEITADIDRLVDMKQEIVKTIEQLPVLEYDLLHKRYVQGKELVDIADDMGRSYTWVTTVHGKALSHVQTIINARKL